MPVPYVYSFINGKDNPSDVLKKILELHRHKEDIIWGACEHDGRPQLSVGDTTGTQTYAMGINSNNSVGVSIDYVSGTIDMPYRRYVNDTIGTSYLRQSNTTTNSACTENNSSNIRTIASYTTCQFVQTSYGTSLIVNDSITQRSDTGRSIHVNGGAATDVIIMEGHVYWLHPGQSRSSIDIVVLLLLEACCYVISASILPI